MNFPEINFVIMKTVKDLGKDSEFVKRLAELAIELNQNKKTPIDMARRARATKFFDLDSELRQINQYVTPNPLDAMPTLESPS